MSLLLQFFQPARHPLHVVQDHHVRDEVVVPDDLALLKPRMCRPEPSQRMRPRQCRCNRSLCRMLSGRYLTRS
jgi:hypothetical protein